MFHHTVMLRFTEGTTREHIDAITDGLASLPAQIDDIVDYRFGPDLGVTKGSWDYVVQADFADADGYRTYSAHPAHQAVLNERIRPFLTELARVQFES